MTGIARAILTQTRPVASTTFFATPVLSTVLTRPALHARFFFSPCAPILNDPETARASAGKAVCVSSGTRSPHGPTGQCQPHERHDPTTMDDRLKPQAAVYIGDHATTMTRLSGDNTVRDWAHTYEKQVKEYDLSYY